MIIVNGECAYRYKYNPYYYITKSGKIYSAYKIGGQGSVDYNNLHPLSYGTDKDGYYRVVLSMNGKKKYIKVHTIIVEQFIGKINYPFVVNHIDGNKKNNSVENLEIVTIKENTIHAHKNGFTTNEIPVCVEYKNKNYQFHSMKECVDVFNDLSIHYLQQLKKKIILFSMILFEKAEINSRNSKINAFYNGSLFKVFDTMKDASLYFKKSKGSVSSAMKNNEYRKRINQYKVSFPNVSTIESTN